MRGWTNAKFHHIVYFQKLRQCLVPVSELSFQFQHLLHPISLPFLVIDDGIDFIDDLSILANST